MSDPARLKPVFWGRVDRVSDEYRARCGVRDPARDRAHEAAPETNDFVSYDDARDWVHLSARQAGFTAIAWDADSLELQAAAAPG